jgi:hypothetical protein
MKVEVHIEELVLHGFAPEDRYRIGEAVEKELAILLARQGIPSLKDGLEIEDMNAGKITVARGAVPEATGAQIARAVYKEMRK